MLKEYLAKRSAKKTAALSLKRELIVVAVMATAVALRKGFEMLEDRFPDWKFLEYRKYIGLK